MRSLRYFPQSGWTAYVMAALLFILPATAQAESFNDALKAYNDKDYQTAFKIYKSLAEQGNPRAQNNLGNMYDVGQGVEQNLELEKHQNQQLLNPSQSQHQNPRFHLVTHLRELVMMK